MLKANVLVGAVFVLGGLVGCGGDSGGSRTGTGGATTGTGGATTGTGGATTGTGGAGGSTGFPCTPAAAPNATITNFADATAAGRWGTAPSTLTGGTFSYAASGSTFTSTVDTAGGNFKMTGSVMGYGGGGLYFDLCTDASRFTGIQFTVAGDLGGCALELQVQTNSDKMIETSGMKGTCTANCSSAAAKMLTAPGTVTLPWASLMGGLPVPFSSNGNKEIVGVQWQLTSAAACTPNITIDDVVWTM